MLCLLHVICLFLEHLSVYIWSRNYCCCHILLPEVSGAVVEPYPTSPLSNHTHFPYSHVLFVPSLLDFAVTPSVLEVFHTPPGIHLSPSVAVPSTTKATLHSVLNPKTCRKNTGHKVCVSFYIYFSDICRNVQVQNVYTNVCRSS